MTANPGTVKWNCSSATCSSTVQLGSAVTDANGDFNGLMVTIPATAPPEPHAIGGLGSQTGAFVRTTFTVK